MSASLAGIDPHQATFTVGIISPVGEDLARHSFPNTAAGFIEAIEVLHAHGVETVGVESSASWGAHVAIALVAAGFDAREVSPQRTAVHRRARRKVKTDGDDAIAVARALQNEPELGPVQVLELYDPLVAKIEAVLEHRRMLVALRTLALHHIQNQLAKLPIEIRDQLTHTGKIETRLRRVTSIDPTAASTIAGQYRLGWLHDWATHDHDWHHQIRQLEADLDRLLDEHGTSLRDEDGIGTIGAATLITEVGDPTRFASEAKFARWCGTGAVAMSSGEGDNEPIRHRLDWGGNRRINSVLYIASVTQQRTNTVARDYLNRKRAEGKPRRAARRSHKRHLANRVIRRMWHDENLRQTTTTLAA